ncbi:right-handed parallel beta-helix repeat-containing protein [Deinococcus roseus]|nr:right-handed parallel beta-helix repeat-containing protein [Deinococcus roseus]
MRRFLLPLLLLLALVLQVANAQVIRSFTPRYNATDTGNIQVIGNTLMTCSTAAGATGQATCAAALTRSAAVLADNNNNNHGSAYVDVDATDTPAFNNSSTATLTLPTNATVLWAGIYWSARDSVTTDSTDRRQVRFKPPGGSYSTLTSAQTDATGADYQSFADVTTQLRTYGSGTYTVGGVRASVGNTTTNTYAVWGLVVVYRDPAQLQPRNLTVFDGYVNINNSTSTISVTGFTTPLQGTVNTEVGVMAYEGDYGLTGDTLSLSNDNTTFTVLSDAQNPSDNSFNSTISRGGVTFSAKNPNYLNNLGVDVDFFTMSGTGNPIKNGNRTAYLKFTSSGDQYFPGVVTFSTDIYQPDMKTTKGVIDVNGGVITASDQLEYVINLKNEGLGQATNVTLSDAIPDNTVYVPGSLKIDGVTVTDANADDRGEYGAFCNSANCIRVRSGTGANSSIGGTFNQNDTTEIRFRVTIGAGVAIGTYIYNRATIDYNTLISNQSYSIASGSASVVVQVGGGLSYELSGKVFTDMNYGGGAGRNTTVGGISGRGNARIEVYDSSGNFVSSTTTSGAGDYFISVPAGTYTFRCVSSTVTSPRSGYVSGLLPVQTYRTNASGTTVTAVTNKVGGEDPSKVDAPSNTTSATLASLTTSTQTAQSVATVTVTNYTIQNIDFGYNFDTIVNTNASGQGSLAQFITNSNALGDESSLAQVGNRLSSAGVTESLPAGVENSIFMIPAAQLTSGVGVINLTAAQTMSGPSTSLDATTQTINIGNTNSVSLGTGGTVGSTSVTFNQIPGPEVRISGARSLNSGLIVTGTSNQIRGLALYGFGAGDSTTPNGALQINAASATVQLNVFGSPAVGLSDPGVGSRTVSALLGANNATGLSVVNNLFAYSGGYSIYLNGTSAGTFTGNEIQNSNIEFPAVPAVRQAGSGVITFSQNRVASNHGSGVGILSGTATLSQNTITNNVQDQTGILAGVRLLSSGNTLSQNLITNNLGTGVLIAGGVSNNTLTQNLIYDNSNLGIDLRFDSTNQSIGDGVTPNDSIYTAAAGNQAIDYPTLTYAVLTGTSLEIKGQVGKAATPVSGTFTIEAFLTDNSPANQNGAIEVGDGLSVGHGEASKYLGTCTTASNGTFNCFFTVSGVTVADSVTLTTTLATYGTSEFSANQQIIAGRTLSGGVYEDVDTNRVKTNPENWASGSTVYVNLLQNSAVYKTFTVNAGTGLYSFTALPPGSYTVIVTSSAAGTSPVVPSGFITVSPNPSSVAATINGADVTDVNFGFFKGIRFSGTVFRDDGRTAGTANNAIQDGQELGMSGIKVTATSGSNTKDVLTDATGKYILYLGTAYAGTAVTISHPERPATGTNLANASVSLASSFSDANASRRTLTLALGNAQDSLNFGVVRSSVLKTNQSQQAFSPSTIEYLHEYQPGTLGTVTFSMTGALKYQFYPDLNCDGTVSAAEKNVAVSLLTVNATWPRDTDGSLSSCPILVRVLVPSNLPAGTKDAADFKASLLWTGPSVTDLVTVKDTTTIQSATGGQLKLTKEVRNVTTGGSFSSTAPATVGQVLEYRISYTNLGLANVSQVILSDPVPNETKVVADVFGTAEVRVFCPTGTSFDLAAENATTITVNLNFICGGGTVVKPSQSGYFLYRVQVQ